MARLEIDPSTPKGQAQLEAIGWAQDQLNEVLSQYFGGKWKMQKGLRIDFLIPQNLDQLNEKIKVSINYIMPKTPKEFDAAIIEARENNPFVEETEVVSEHPMPDPENAGQKPTQDLENPQQKGGKV